jgi:murein DD-endopeptidase MepM/ murein hydrolase activator NlpD
MSFLRPLALFFLAIAISAPSAAAAQALYHVIQPGETLYSVAKKYDLDSDTLVAANGISDASKLKPGQKLLIPEIHKVRKGETLYGIARSYGIAVEELRKANNLSTRSIIRVGDALVVPGRLPASADPAPAAASPNAGTASAPIPLAPPAVKTSAKAVDKKVSWPCQGEAIYLDGKAQGVMIRARQGEAEKAVAAGKVISAGPFRGYGQMAIVMSRTGYLYVYAGNESLSVKVGDTVRSGQELGRVGVDSKEGTPVAYFIVYRGRDAVDPADAPRD